VEASSPAAPEPAAPSSPAEPAVETSSPAEPVAPSSAPAAAADEPETLTAAEAIAVIQAAGLPVGEVRDNTNGNCPTIGCEALITTDYVSAYQWPSPEDAADNESFGPGREHVRFGRVVLHFGGDSDFWPFDTAPYVDAAAAALASQ
jgi:hypothetical protein